MKSQKFTLIIVTFIICTNAFAQIAIKEQKTIGGRSYDFLRSMDTTRDGGIIMGGSSSSGPRGDKTDTSRGNNDYWVVKLSKSGSIEWDKTIGGKLEDELYSVQQTIDGGYILGGFSKSNKSGEKSENRRGQNDYWVVKLDSAGNVEWDKTIGGSGEDELYALKATRDGGCIMGGWSNSGISFEKTDFYRGIWDYWVVKLDASGNIQWDKTIGGTDADDLNALQQTSDGGYILAGNSSSAISYEKTENSRGGFDYWIVKLDSLGDIQWDKTIGGFGADNLTSVIETKDNGYVLGGYSSSSVGYEKTENTRGVYDYWVIKLDSLRNRQWDKTAGGADHDYMADVQQTSDGGYIMGGYSKSNMSGDKTEDSRGFYDFWIVKLNTNGKIVQEKTIGGSDDDWLASVREKGRNNFLLAGFSFSNISGEKTQNSKGYNDYWIVYVSHEKNVDFAKTSETEQSSTLLQKNNWTIYPNPSKNILHIRINGEAIFTLTNQSGKILLSKTINNKGEINVAHLAAGLYYLKNNATGAVQKVIVTK